MIRLIFPLCFFVLLLSCNTSKKENVLRTDEVQIEEKKDSAENFFPLTAFLRGDIAQIRELGITPILKNIKNEKTIDSQFVKQEDYQKVFADFLSPDIDSTNLKRFYVQSRFLDQSVNAFTFTYDGLKGLADSLPLKHWDIYVDPQTGKVRRVFMLKRMNADEETQLTWQSGKWCTIVLIKNKADKKEIISEKKIEWSFD
jgi:hypothetical protein